MIDLKRKADCCGCGACVSACPKDAISLKYDEEGFLYPQTEKSLCVDCGLCNKVCPIINLPPMQEEPQVYAAKQISDREKEGSSSGAIFPALAKIVLERNGIVFGAAFDKDWSVSHQYVDKLSDLHKLRRSKYVQSNIGEAYKQAKDFLDKNRLVFFSGTPCQIAGLKTYLGKDYSNLLTADILCHGVPSPAVWKKFLKENFDIKEIKAIDFRDKFFAWDSSYLSVTLSYGKLPNIPNCLKPFRPVFYARQGYLFRNFFSLSYRISNLYERPSCHQCPFKGRRRSSDMTMGDLWGVKKFCPDMYDRKGVSVLLVNTERGKHWFDLIKPHLTYKTIPLKEIEDRSGSYARCIPPNIKRSEFFASYRKERLNKLIPRLLGQRSPFISIMQDVSRKLFKR